MKEYFEQLHVHKFDNPDEMDQLLEKHKLPKLTQGETDHLYRPISIKEMKSIANYLTKKESTSPKCFYW